MKMGFDLKRFKKVHEDKDWANLIHEDGHQIRIAKAPLSPIQRKQVEKLEMHEQYAEGGFAGGYPDGGEVQDINLDQKAPLVAENTADDQDPQSASLPDAAQSQGEQNPYAAQAAAQIPGYQEEQAANVEAAKAIGAQGTQEAGVLNQGAQDLSRLPTQAQLVDQNRDASATLYKRYADKTLDPDAYWDNHSKIQAGIGLLLSGAGQAIGQGKVGNVGLETLQGQINRNIMAQQADQSQAYNLWKMNREALGSDVAANVATQAQLWTGIKYKLDKIAAQSKGPQALAAAHLASAKIDQIIGGKHVLLSLMGGPTQERQDPAQLVPFLVPPDRQKEVLDEINAAKQTVANAPGVFQAFEQARNDSRLMTGGPFQTSPRTLGALSPFEATHTLTPGQEALIGRVTPMVMGLTGSVKQAEIENIAKTMNPGLGDSDLHVDTKGDTLEAYLRNNATKASASKAFGIDLTKFPATNTLAIKRPNIQKQAAAARQPAFAIINGKRVAGSVPVKANPKMVAGK